MIIREATFDDADQILALGQQMYDESVFKHIPFEERKVRFSIAGIIANPRDGTIIVAEDNGELLGFIAAVTGDYFFSDAKYAAELALYVRKDSRGGTSAARLVRQFEEWAKSVGAVEAQVGVQVGVDDDLAISLYRRLGYVRRGTGLVKRLKAD